jgi:hypothetical protein
MIKASTRDFRVTFARMADQAIVTRSEVAELLATTPGALSQMVYRGELPATAFPRKRRACWYVRDIRAWLDAAAAARNTVTSLLAPSSTSDGDARRGRPRHPATGTGE